MAERQDSPETGSAEDEEEEGEDVGTGEEGEEDDDEELEEVEEEEDVDEAPEAEVTQPSEEEPPVLGELDLELAASLGAAGQGLRERVAAYADRDPDQVAGEIESESLQRAMRVAQGATRPGETGRTVAESVGWSAAEALPGLAELAFGAPRRAREQQAFLKDWDPEGLTEAQELAFAAEEAGAGARAREGRLRQQALEAARGEGASARDLQRTRDAYRRELQEASTKIGMTRAITDIALENQQEAQRQTDLDQLAQFSTQYYRNLIGTPLKEVVGSMAGIRARQISYRAAPDVESSVAELRSLGVEEDDIAAIIFFAQDKDPDERRAYLASITTAYQGPDGAGDLDLTSGATEPEGQPTTPGEEALLEQTATTPDGSGWQLPNDGVNVHGPFGLEGDDAFQYYWDQNGGRYIAFVEGQEDPIVIRKDNMVANNRLEPAFTAYQASLEQGQ